MQRLLCFARKSALEAVTPLTQFAALSRQDYRGTETLFTLETSAYTAVSTKVVPQKCESARDNADWHYG